MLDVSEKNVFTSLPDLKAHVRYCHHLAPVVVDVTIRKPMHFNLLLWNSHLVMNFNWIIPYKVHEVFVDEKYTKETRGPNV